MYLNVWSEELLLKGSKKESIELDAKIEKILHEIPRDGNRGDAPWIDSMWSCVHEGQRDINEDSKFEMFVDGDSEMCVTSEEGQEPYKFDTDSLAPVSQASLDYYELIKSGRSSFGSIVDAS
jgi:hypothetical protein